MDSPLESPATNSSSPARGGEISLVEVVNILLRHRRLIVLLPLAFGLVAGTWSLTRTRTYAATTSILPEGAAAQGGGAFAGLMRQFVDVGARGSSQFYADLLLGREILRKAVETEYDVPTDTGSTTRETLIEVYGIEASRWLPAWQIAADELAGRMAVVVMPATGVLELKVSAHHPQLAEQVAERLLELLNEFNLVTRQSRAEEESRFVAERMTEAEEALLEAENRLKTFLERNRAIEGSPELTFEHDRLQRQVDMRQAIFTSLARSYEQARIDGVRDTPVFTVTAGPAGSARPERRGTVTRTIFGMILGTMLGVGLAFALEFRRRLRAHGYEERGAYSEFSRLTAEAREDLLRPIRVLRRRPASKPPVASR